MLTSLSMRTGHVEGPLHVGRHVVPVPARHDRRVDRASGRVLDGTGQPDARSPPGRRAGAPASASSSPTSPDPPSRARARARRRCPGRRAARRGPCPARSASAARAWVAPRSTPDDDPGTRVEGQQRRRATAGGDPVAVRRHQAEPQQHVDAGGDRGPGQARWRRPAARGSGAARPGAGRRRRWSARRGSQALATLLRPANNFCRTLDRSAVTHATVTPWHDARDRPRCAPTPSATGTSCCERAG